MKYHNEIQKLEKKLASLKSRAAKSAAKNKKTALQKVTSLVKKLGYASIHHLLQNVDDAIAAVPERVRKRSKITIAIRKSVVAALKTGKTAVEIAKMHKISAPSVNNIKKAAGMTRSKGAASKPRSIRVPVKKRIVGAKKRKNTPKMPRMKDVAKPAETTEHHKPVDSVVV